MKTTTSRRSLLRNSAAAVAALGLGGKHVRAQDAPIRIGVIYDLSGPFAAAGSVPCAICAPIDAGPWFAVFPPWFSGSRGGERRAVAAN